MLEMAADPECDFYFSEPHVIDYCAFAESLHHFEPGLWERRQIDENGNPDSHIILEPWQIWIEAAIQGFRKRITGERLVSLALEVVPRKNAKSLRAVAAALYDLLCTGGMAPQIVIAASTVSQAKKTVFGDIIGVLNVDPDLKDYYGITILSEEVKCGSGEIFILNSKGERADGLNPSLAIFEEGHAGAESVYRVVDSAFGARPNGLRRMITTAGYRPEGPAFQLLLETKLILEGKSENYSFFAAIYTLDEELYLDPDTRAIDWNRLLSDESLIKRTNPMWGVALDMDKLRQDMEKAKRRADLRGEFARTRHNVWTAMGTSLIDLATWQSCKRDIRLEDFFDQKCWIGVDMAQKLDMCAIGLVFELPDDTLAVFAKFFLPEMSETFMDPELNDILSIWADEGWLTITDGPMADHDRVREEVEAYCEVFDVQIIACDPHQAHNTVHKLWDGDRPVMTYPNSAPAMTPPTDDIVARIHGGKLVHDGNPVLAWNASNVHGERKGNGLILPRKETPNSTRKIDGFVAVCLANGYRMTPDFAKIVKDDRPRRSVYEERGPADRYRNDR